ncbi:MAG: hypothetical protein EU542_02870 [Promethearchaeota archaeon]|nr:MAG: hypothetical protein EU542_02870 [Candidatus Lokiarchaeota archaeon]
MDTGYDYITPEFLNLIFFQRKNIVIYPYLDLKHLHSLEVFAVGYNIIDLDGAAIHNIVDLLEHESYNSYSQNPSLFIISNITEPQLRQIIALDSIHCIINVNENLEKFPIEGKSFVFYNKKSKKFLNFSMESTDLSFETWLIKNSQNQSILQDKIIKIKSIATQLFTEINNDADKKQLIELLSEYEKKYWDKIIQFTENYYQIEFPQVPRVHIPSNSVTEERIDEHMKEYELIIKSNNDFAGEFVKALHEYRSKKVNPANLELMELFSPRQLYCYLRKHHWDQGIPEDFIQEWLNMITTHYLLTQSDKQDFLTLFSKLNISSANIEFPSIKKGQIKLSSSETNKKTKNEDLTVANEIETKIPSIEDFALFKQWIYKKLEQIETRLKS